MTNKSKKSVNDTLRNRYFSAVSKYLAETLGEEVLVTNSNEVCVPCVDDNGDDSYVVITFKVPTGSRDGEAYDGYIAAQDYADKVAAKKAKAAAAAEAKAKKIAYDKSVREAKAKARAEAKAAKEAATA